MFSGLRRLLGLAPDPPAPLVVHAWSPPEVDSDLEVDLESRWDLDFKPEGEFDDPDEGLDSRPPPVGADQETSDTAESCEEEDDDD